jgi:hypothetical protein
MRVYKTSSALNSLANAIQLVRESCLRSNGDLCVIVCAATTVLCEDSMSVSPLTRYLSASEHKVSVPLCVCKAVVAQVMSALRRYSLVILSMFAA